MNSNFVRTKIKEIVLKENPTAEVILFGSRARNEARSDSDWDILVLLQKDSVTLKDEQMIRHKLYDLELESGEVFSTFVYSKHDWNTKLSVTPLYKNVVDEGINL